MRFASIVTTGREKQMHGCSPARQRALILAALLLTACASSGGPPPVHELSRLELEHRIYMDYRLLESASTGLGEALAFCRERPDLFPEKERGRKELLPTESRDEVRSLWASMLDRYMALDSVKRYHQDYWRIANMRLRKHSFAILYTTFLVQYSTALQFLELARNNPDLDVLLDEPIPELGLSQGTFGRFKTRFLNVAAATEFAALDVTYSALKKPDVFGLSARIEEARGHVLEAGKGTGIEMTIENAGTIISKAGFSAYFPVQAGISEWMGDTKVHRTGESLVKPEQIATLTPDLRPGDALFERREWYLSNIGLPGFWPHVAIYIGTQEERRAFFAGDAETADWVRSLGEPSGDLETLLTSSFPKAMETANGPGEHEHPYRCIEAISEGVVFTTIEHSADCDSLAVLRPKLSKKEVARGLYRSIYYAGRPYDFNFDFVTDSSLVCTELLFKAFEPAEGFAGLQFPIETVAGHRVVPANGMIRQFDKTMGTAAQQFDFIAFLDGHEKKGEAIPATLEELRQSHKRPKWHILTQE